ncbi:MAG: GNAT family N-acetyltransferase [Candidatus Bipolaricaulis sp.]|nr:GNAT family N-acetyltransferase [Candidatus Bipolaricaulis sp.]
MAEPSPFEWRLRAPTLEDFDGIVAMAAARADRLRSPTRPTREGWRRWWEGQVPTLSANHRVAVDRAGQVVGLASVNPASEPFLIVLANVSVGPDHWDHEPLWDALSAWVVERAAANVHLAPPDAEVNLMAEAVESDVPRTAALTRAGFKRTRVFFRMRIDFDGDVEAAPSPAGVEVRRIDMERELLDVARVHAEAFRDHWGHAEQSPESFAEEWRHDTIGQRTDFNYIAVADGGVVGYVLCEDNYRGDPAIGLVSYLGVRPAWRQRGIARALLETAFQTLRAQGYAAARLGVDATSPTGALRLYEKVGMRAIEQVNRYERVLRPGIDVRPRPGG